MNTEQTLRFLDAVTQATADHKIDIPGSKHHGKTLGEYRKEVAFIDLPKHELLPFHRDTEYMRLCGHGTNIYSVLMAMTLSAGNLIPGNKQLKLIGKPQTGESFGTTPLNQKFVSTVNLATLSSSFSKIAVNPRPLGRGYKYPVTWKPIS